MHISNHNLSAVIANNRLKKQEDIVSKSMERLSTGISINQAKDHPAHMALSNKFSTHISGMEEARKNADNTASMLHTADSVLKEINEMLKRMHDLAEEAANGTLQDSDRDKLQKEVAEIRDEIDRMSKDTEYNSKRIFDGSMGRRVYPSRIVPDANGIFQPDVTRIDVSPEVKAGEYKLKVNSLASGLENAKVELLGTESREEGFPPTASVSTLENRVTITGPNGFAMYFELSKDLAADTEVTLNVTDVGSFQVQFGENEGNTLDISIPRVDPETLYIDDMDVTTEEGASRGMSMVDESMRYLTRVRSQLGAYDNRMEDISISLSAKNENLTNSLSKLRDTDMAAEMTEYTSGNILVQASTSVLSQCNDQPEMVLQILQ